MKFTVEQKKNIGSYLRKLIEDSGLNSEKTSVRQFCKRFLEYQGIKADDDSIKNMENRFIDILNGKKAIQSNDLLTVSELLKISVEEILSAGQKKYVFLESHVRNYDIAASHDKAVWEKYINRENEFLVCKDEYGKTIIDYAVEFKNYDFIKYLIDGKYLWFASDLEKDDIRIMKFGCGTNMGSVEKENNDITYKIMDDDNLRKEVIILAIENSNDDMLTSLHARESFDLLGYIAYGAEWNKADERITKFADEKNQDIVDRIIRTENGKIVDYFSDEFSIRGAHRADNSFIYPYIADIIEGFVNREKYDSAEKTIRKVLHHNKKVFERVSEYIEASINEEYEAELKALNETIEEMRKNGISEEQIEEIKKKRLDKGRMKSIVLDYELKFDKGMHIISVNHILARGFVCNIVDVDTSKINNAPAAIQNLLAELNDWYRKVIELGGKRNV